MDRRYKHKRTTNPMPANPYFGTFSFLQPRHATAHKNVKEPKFTSRAPSAPSVLTIGI